MEITSAEIKKRSLIVIITVLSVLVIDQVFKFWIKTNMTYGEEFGILGLSWARIHFVENPGMAFGILPPGNFGKLALGIFRLVAIGFLIYLLISLIKTYRSRSLIFCFSLILAGAIGNILDSAFYGLIFSESSYHGEPAVLFPESGGYAGFLYGKVVDMLYFPLIDTTLPNWVPIWGGKPFEFFRPVFNIADSAISTGVIAILIFHREIFKSTKTKDKAESKESPTEDIKSTTESTTSLTGGDNSDK